MVHKIIGPDGKSHRWFWYYRVTTFYICLILTIIAVLLYKGLL